MTSDVDVDIIDKLRKGIHVNEFNESSVQDFREIFDTINASHQAPYIPIYIDSFGGDCYSLLAMVDIISSAQKPVLTVAVGKAMSCGAVLLSCGTKGYRFATENCTIMLHDVHSWQRGKVHDIRSQTDETERLSALFFEILDKNSGKNTGYFEKFFKIKDRTDIYLNSHEALEHGLIDDIGYPLLVPNFGMELFIPEKEQKPEPKTKRKTTRKTKK